MTKQDDQTEDEMTKHEGLPKATIDVIRLMTRLRDEYGPSCSILGTLAGAAACAAAGGQTREGFVAAAGMMWILAVLEMKRAVLEMNRDRPDPNGSPAGEEAAGTPKPTGN